MGNDKINFDFDFLDTTSTNNKNKSKSDWECILELIKHMPTKAFFRTLGTPVTVNKSNVTIQFNSNRVIEQAYLKESHLLAACNSFYNQDNTNIQFILKDEENKISYSTAVSNEETVRSAIDSIFEKCNINNETIATLDLNKIDHLIECLEDYTVNIHSDSVNNEVADDLNTFAQILISQYNKNLEALSILKFAQSIAKSNNIKQKLQENIDIILPSDTVDDSSQMSFTKIKYGDNSSDINWKPIIITFIIIIIGGVIGWINHLDNVRTKEIEAIKSSAYSYLKSSNNEAFVNEVQRLEMYGLDVANEQQKLIDKLAQEKHSIISRIAFNYENNKERFYALKQEYLPKYFNNDETLFNETIEKELGYKELTLTPLKLPKSGILHNLTGKDAIAPFEIKTTGSDENYYIKLVDPYSDKTAVIIFVKGGETIKVDVPIGTYKLKRASGNTWYGEEYLFGHNTSYTTSDQYLDFHISGSYVNGHTLTLYKVANGNFETKNLDPSDF